MKNNDFMLKISYDGNDVILSGEEKMSLLYLCQDIKNRTNKRGFCTIVVFAEEYSVVSKIASLLD